MECQFNMSYSNSNSKNQLKAFCKGLKLDEPVYQANSHGNYFVAICKVGGKCLAPLKSMVGLTLGHRD